MSVGSIKQVMFKSNSHIHQLIRLIIDHEDTYEHKVNPYIQGGLDGGVPNSVFNKIFGAYS